MRDTVVPTLGLKYTGNRCTSGGARGRCRFVPVGELGGDVGLR